MTKEEVLAAIRQCARKLRRNREAGLEPSGSGHSVKTADLLNDWACVARKLQKIPSAHDYRRHGRYSPTPFSDRFGRWVRVPEMFLAFVRSGGNEYQWKDVEKMVAARHQQLAQAAGVVEAPSPVESPHSRGRLYSTNSSKRKTLGDRPLYGAPLCLPGLAHEPVNEAGVIYVFGMVAHQLRFVVLRMQSGFPDCEAMREVQPGRWQRVRIEFEFESRNFVKHGHNKEECDLIVCWTHNWPECPGSLEVIELQRVTKTL